ncbi:MAG: hypothetical protein ACREJ2_17620 [Planctomycetota bacterium]
MTKQVRRCGFAGLLGMLACACLASGRLTAVDRLAPLSAQLDAPAPTPAPRPKSTRAQPPAVASATKPSTDHDFSDADFSRADQPALGKLAGGDYREGVDIWMIVLRILLIGLIIDLFDDGHHHARPYHSHHSGHR